MKLLGKVALITGASLGMGRSHAELFIKEGAIVYIADINDKEGLETTKQLGERAHYIHLNVTDENDWIKAMAIIQEKSGKLDILVNNAGISIFNSLTDMSKEQYMQIVEINQLSVFLGMKYALPLLEKGTDASIVNVSSIEGMRGSAGGHGYVGSKFAVRGMTKAAALELASRNIRVNSVHPGGVETPMVLEAKGEQKRAIDAFKETIPMKRMAKSEEISRLVLFLASNDASYSTGGEFIADGGILA